MKTSMKMPCLETTPTFHEVRGLATSQVPRRFLFICKCNNTIFCCVYSCHGEQTQRHVYHPGDRKPGSSEDEKNGKEEGEGKGTEEESLPEEV